MLAAEKLGLDLDASLLSKAPPPGTWKGARYAKSSVLEAAVLMAGAGNEQLSARFLLHLGESLSDAELGTLAGLGLNLGQYRSAVLIAKAAAERGVIVPGALPIVRFTTEARLQEMINFCRSIGVSIANPHINHLEGSGRWRLDDSKLVAKREFDPQGRMNPVRMIGCKPATTATPDPVSP